MLARIFRVVFVRPDFLRSPELCKRWCGIGANENYARQGSIAGDSVPPLL